MSPILPNFLGKLTGLRKNEQLNILIVNLFIRKK